MIIYFAFYVSAKGKKEVEKATKSGVVDWGIYKLSPLTGNKATKIIFISKYIVLFAPWVIIILIFLFNYL